MNNERLAITGAPDTGKTVLAKEYVEKLADWRGVRVYHTDDLIPPVPTRESWSQASLEASFWFSNPGPWIVEGVAVPRALRKWIERNQGRDIRPCDRVVYLENRPFETPTKGKLTMAKGIESVWAEVFPELIRRGVQLERMSVPFDSSKVGR